MAPGVYFGQFEVFVPNTNPLNVVNRTNITVYVGGATLGTFNNGNFTVSSTGVVSGTGQINISVPAGLPFNSISQPPSVIITALSNSASTPLSVSGPTWAAGSFPTLASNQFCVAANGAPGQPTLPCAIQVRPLQGACSSFAPTPQQTNSASCSYAITVDATALLPGTYNGTLNFTAGGVTLPVPVSITVTSFPQVMAFQQIPIGNGNSLFVPAAGFSFTGTAGQDLTQCQFMNIAATGGQVSGVQVQSIGFPWLGFSNPNNTGNNPGVFFNATSGGFTLTQSSGFNSNGLSVCVNAASLPNRPAILNGTLTISAPGINPFGIPVTFNLSAGTSGQQLYQQIAQFRTIANTGAFILDSNGNYGFDATDKIRFFGSPGDTPVAGDWDGTGVIRIGVFRCTPGFVCAWYIDMNNNGTWDGPTIDSVFFFGSPGDIPVVGDWNGDGKSKIGVFRCPAGAAQCQWYLQLSTTGDRSYNAATVTTALYGVPGDLPVVNNWGGGPQDQIGIFRNGLWAADTNANGVFDATDLTFNYGVAGDRPLVGNWFGTTPGRRRIGVFRPSTGQVILNISGTNVWVGGPTADFVGFFGTNGDLPVVGFWTMP